MTKRAILIGLICAVIVLAIVFMMFKPEGTEAPSDTQNQTTDGSQPADSNDDTDSLDQELDSLNSDINSDTDIDLGDL